MMNRVFDPEATIDVGADGGEAARPGQHRLPAQPQAPAAPARPQAHAEKASEPLEAAAEAGRRRRHDQSLLLITALAGMGLVSAASSIFYVSHWNRLQQSLSQERNLLLVERLRSLGPAIATPLTGPEPVAPSLPQPSLVPSAPATTAAPGSSADGLPPPPPEEPWIQQLSSLPGSGSPAPSGLLRVPVSPQLRTAPPQAPAPASAPPRPAASAPPLPQLVGVVGAAGRTSSAIFLVSGTSMSVGPGETIGSSGWRLRSADGETALIEKGGDLRQVSIINGF